MNAITGIGSNNLHISGSPLLTEYDFRATSFYDGYMSMSVMANRIENDMRFEEKLKRLHENKMNGKAGKQQ